MVGLHDLVRESNRDFSDKIVIAILIFFFFYVLKVLVAIKQYILLQCFFNYESFSYKIQILNKMKNTTMVVFHSKIKNKVFKKTNKI